MSEHEHDESAAPAAAAPKKSKLPWILLGCGCVGLPCLVLAAFVGFGIMKATELFKAPAEAARAHVTLAAQDADAAYENCSDSFKSSVSIEAFRQYVQDTPVIYTATDLSFGNVNIQNNICNMNGTATGPDGEAPVHFVLYLRSGESPLEASSWQVHELPFTN